MAHLSLNVTGMSCAGCGQRIANVLGRLDGVRDVTADHATGTVVVVHDPAVIDEAAIAERLADAGYQRAEGAQR